MSELRARAERIVRMGGHASYAPDRKLRCERAAERLAGRASGDLADREPWDAFLRRIGVI